ncbi:MAG: RNA polymerase sigma factor [Candidatus Taylorbacteria bacterium]|nr:RNA polymerase sigma factor [Candidatus Taylorbacteria bacterium]
MPDFDQIVEEYTRPIYNFVYRLCGSREEAEDLTQEVFLKVWKNLGKFDPEKSSKTWIFTIARNTTIDWLRKKKSINFSQMDTAHDEPFEDGLADIEPLPDEIFQRKELAYDLESALSKIPPDHKMIILLHHTEDLTFEEISIITDKPMNTVKSQYRRALIMLRKYL